MKKTKPLIHAAKHGFLQLVRYFLDRGEDVNAQTSTTADTALTIACEYGHTEIADLLIQAGADLVGRQYFLCLNCTKQIILLLLLASQVRKWYTF